MYCSGCGQALVAGQGFCPRCGRVNEFAMPMAPLPVGPANWLPLARVERQVNALAVGWFIYAGLSGLAGLVGLAFARAWLGGHMGGFGPWQGHFGHRILEGPMMPLFFFRFAWLALALRVGLAAAAGYGLLQKTTWGRWVAIVAACLALFHFPFGTALAIWTLVLMLKAPNAAAYEAMAR